MSWVLFVGGRQAHPGFDLDLPTELAFKVYAPKGSWVVVSDSYYPGWQAQIDGEPTEIFPAFINLRGIWVPPGEHMIRMFYRPRVFSLGAFLSVLGWFVCAGLYATMARRLKAWWPALVALIIASGYAVWRMAPAGYDPSRAGRGWRALQPARTWRGAGL